MKPLTIATTKLLVCRNEKWNKVWESYLPVENVECNMSAFTSSLLLWGKWSLKYKIKSIIYALWIATRYSRARSFTNRLKGLRWIRAVSKKRGNKPLWPQPKYIFLSWMIYNGVIWYQVLQHSFPWMWKQHVYKHVIVKTTSAFFICFSPLLLLMFTMWHLF